MNTEHSGRLVCGSKYIEVHFHGGKVVAMGDQLGLDRVTVR